MHRSHLLILLWKIPREVAYSIFHLFNFFAERPLLPLSIVRNHWCIARDLVEFLFYRLCKNSILFMPFSWLGDIIASFHRFLLYIVPRMELLIIIWYGTCNADRTCIDISKADQLYIGLYDSAIWNSVTAYLNNI